MVTSDMYRDIKEFRVAYGLPLASEEGSITKEALDLHSGLILEEARELREALDTYHDRPLSARAEVLKEAIDLLYVTVGLLVHLGLPLTEAWRRVHESNMSKLGDDGKPVYRGDGKVLKGPNYAPPYLGDLV